MALLEHMLVISPIGDIDEELIESISVNITRTFGFPTKLRSLIDDVCFAYDPDRMQHYSTIILEKLASKAPEEAIRVFAITTEDLYIPILTYVYGEAQLGGTACIVSTHRLREGLSSNSQAYRSRVIKEAIHEMGHTFKLRHCKDQTCIMHYCRSIKDVDKKSDQFCRYCKVLLDDEKKSLEKSISPAS